MDHLEIASFHPAQRPKRSRRISFSIHRIRKRKKRDREKLSDTSRAPKSARASSHQQSATCQRSDGSSSARDEAIFVDVNEIVVVNRGIKRSDPGTMKRIVAQLVGATEREPVKKSSFTPRELLNWMKENDKRQLRARFGEIFAGVPTKKLRWVPRSKDSFEAKLHRSQLEANLARWYPAHNATFGDGHFAVDRLDLKPSFSLHLFQAGFTFNSRSANFHPHSLMYRAMLRSIDNGEIPSFSEEFLREVPSVVYYNGCLVVDLYDYRGLNSPEGKAKKTRVLLRPTTHTIIKDALALATGYRKQLAQEGRQMTEESFSSIRAMFEEKLLLTCGPQLCFDPTVRVMQVATVANYNRCGNAVRRVQRNELRVGLKPARTWNPRKRSVSTLDFEGRKIEPATAVEEDGVQEGKEKQGTTSRLPPTPKPFKTTADRKLDPVERLAEPKSDSEYFTPLFAPKEEKKGSTVTQQNLKRIRQSYKLGVRTSDNALAGTRLLSQPLMRYASFVHFTKGDRQAHLHQLLLNDAAVPAPSKLPASSDTTVAQTSSMAQTPASSKATPLAVNPAPPQLAKANVTVKPELRRSQSGGLHAKPPRALSDLPGSMNQPKLAAKLQANRAASINTTPTIASPTLSSLTQQQQQQQQQQQRNSNGLRKARFINQTHVNGTANRVVPTPVHHGSAMANRSANPVVAHHTASVPVAAAKGASYGTQGARPGTHKQLLFTAKGGLPAGNQQAMHLAARGNAGSNQAAFARQQQILMSRAFMQKPHLFQQALAMAGVRLLHSAHGHPG